MIMLVKRWPCLILEMTSSGTEAVQVAGLTDPVWEGNSNIKTDIKFQAKINCQMRNYLELHRTDDSTPFKNNIDIKNITSVI